MRPYATSDRNLSQSVTRRRVSNKTRSTVMAVAAASSNPAFADFGIGYSHRINPTTANTIQSAQKTPSAAR